ncbi:MAG: DUF2892 domain-containing protein [Gammaproteobacteria bacterium]|nr:DUF2892 domain-containing protein [Gammaproteobacteria bacterium]
MKFPLNMSILDRVLRTIGSIYLIYIGFINTELLANPLLNLMLGGFGVFNIVFVAVGFCPVYFIAGISTTKKS